MRESSQCCFSQCQGCQDQSRVASGLSEWPRCWLLQESSMVVTLGGSTISRGNETLAAWAKRQKRCSTLYGRRILQLAVTFVKSRQSNQGSDKTQGLYEMRRVKDSTRLRTQRHKSVALCALRVAHPEGDQGRHFHVLVRKLRHQSEECVVFSSSASIAVLPPTRTKETLCKSSYARGFP